MTKAKDFAANGFRSLNNTPLTTLPVGEVSQVADFTKNGVHSFTKANIMPQKTAFPKTAAFNPTLSFCDTKDFENVRFGAQVKGPEAVAEHKDPLLSLINPKTNGRAS